MASLRILMLLTFALMIICHQPRCISADKIDVGVVLSLYGNNFPSRTDMVALYKKYNIGEIRLLCPDSDILDALRGSDIDVTVSVPNDEIILLARSQDGAELWFQNNLARYVDDITFSYISIGNDAIPGNYSANIKAAMYWLTVVLRGHDLTGIAVTTIVSTKVLQNTYPPSAATFTPEAKPLMMDVLNFLKSKMASPVLLINVYPYFNYSADPYGVRLDYAQFTATQPKFHDQNLSYYNLFDAMVDGFFWAMEKANASEVVVGVTETGWPTFGEDELTSPMLAAAYNKKFMEHMLSHKGTPKRPGVYMDGFIFSMFNENLKSNGICKNFGLFYVDMTPVYSLFPSS